MKKILTYFLVLAFTLSVNADLIYFWVSDKDMAYKNLTEYDFSAFIVENESGSHEILNLRKAKASDVGASGNHDARISDFASLDGLNGIEHYFHEVGNNNKSVVYQIDTGSMRIEDLTSYTFMIELDNYNGTDYSTSFAASDLTRHFGGQLHMCDGLIFSEQPVPEPNSLLLCVIGAGLILLRRKTR